MQAILLRMKTFLADLFHQLYEQYPRENVDGLMDLIERGADCADIACMLHQYPG